MHHAARQALPYVRAQVQKSRVHASQFHLSPTTPIAEVLRVLSPLAFSSPLSLQLSSSIRDLPTDPLQQLEDAGCCRRSTMRRRRPGRGGLNTSSLGGC